LQAGFTPEAEQADRPSILSATAPQDNPAPADDLPRGSAFSRRWSAPLGGLILAVLTVYLSFNAGGFFPGATAYATVGVAILVVIGIMVLHEPLTSSPPALLAAIGAICAFAALTLLSGSWSHSWSRAVLEFDRALLYALVLVLFGLMPQREDGLEWGLRGFAVAAFVVCAIAWITRVEPNLWPIAVDVRPQRLSFPLTYWNSLGLLAALGSVALLHLTCGERQLKAVRVAAAAAIPLMLSTLILTFSRSSLVVCALGVVLYLALARPRRALVALPALLIPAAVALALSVRAHTVSSARYTIETSQGHHLALAVIACVAVAALLRGASLFLDDRIDRRRLPQVSGRRLAAVGAGIAVVVVIVGLAAGGGSWVSHRWNHFVNENAVGHIEDPSARLSSVGNNGRIPQWRVAIDAFDEDPIVGKGAGTYAVQWLQHRPYDFTVLNAHSLYAEVMGELGIIGLLLIVALLLAFLVGAARRMRGRDRQVYGAFLAMAVIWAIRAGVDWDWQMPAITIWLFALGGLAISRPMVPRQATQASGARRFPRLVGALCVAVLAITPVVIALSQTHLEKALAAFEANECPASIKASLESIDALGVRPEPYELIGYCDARYGQYELAERAMESAVSRDPENWEMHYGLGLVQASSGKNPLPALREARRLNPLEPLVTETLSRFEKAKGPAERERLAARASLPV
jgi:tetratricopeptide (TPR) repeat protein